VIRRAISDPHFVRNIDWADKAVEVSDTVEGAGSYQVGAHRRGSGDSEGKNRSCKNSAE